MGTRLVRETGVRNSLPADVPSLRREMQIMSPHWTAIRGLEILTK